MTAYVTQYLFISFIGLHVNCRISEFVDVALIISYTINDTETDTASGPESMSRARTAPAASSCSSAKYTAIRL